MKIKKNSLISVLTPASVFTWAQPASCTCSRIWCLLPHFALSVVVIKIYFEHVESKHNSCTEIKARLGTTELIKLYSKGWKWMCLKMYFVSFIVLMETLLPVKLNLNSRFMINEKRLLMKYEIKQWKLQIHAIELKWNTLFLFVYSRYIS